jgi:hypothetical protein
MRARPTYHGVLRLSVFAVTSAFIVACRQGSVLSLVEK